MNATAAELERAKTDAQLTIDHANEQIAYYTEKRRTAQREFWQAHDKLKQLKAQTNAE